MSCKEIVELVTEYLDGALPPQDQARFEEHLAICPGCVAYVEQVRTTVRTVETLREDAIPPATREALLDAFRDWKRP